MKLRHAILPAALIAAAAGPAAHATTAGISQTTIPCTTDDCRYTTPQELTSASLDVSAGPGEANRITITRFPDHVGIRDEANPVTPGAGCTAVDANEASCPALFAGMDYVLTASAGDGDDSVTLLDSNPGPASTAQGLAISGETVAGGPGNDSIVGGPLADRLSGGPGADTLTGGPGDDTLLADTTSADSLDGGPGRDVVDFSGSKAPVTVDLADPAPDSGNTLTALENVVGGAAGDSLTGDAGPNQLDGGRGDDSLRGQDGADELLGRAGRDTFSAGRGDDALDSSEVGSELDLVRTPRGARPERPDCGPGNDVIARSDRIDTIPASCETMGIARYDSLDPAVPTGYVGVRSHPRVTRSRVIFRFRCENGYAVARCIGSVNVNGNRRKFSVKRGRTTTFGVKRGPGKPSIRFALDQEAYSPGWTIG